MDKYFIFVDQNAINVFFSFFIIILITIIVMFVSEKLFRIKYSGLIFVVLFIAKFIIGGRITNNDNQEFIKSSIHSVIIEHFENRAGMYRNKLRNSMVFYSIDEVTIGDSIVKKANSNTYQKYKKDDFGNYVFVKEYNY